MIQHLFSPGLLQARTASYACISITGFKHSFSMIIKRRSGYHAFSIFSLLLFGFYVSSAQPTLVKDINTIPKSELSQHDNLINLNGLLFFTAFSPSYGTELWKTDGTLQGTKLIKDISPGGASTTIRNLLVINNTLFFSANTNATDTTSIELWKTDGTLQGTMVIKDIKPGASGSYPQHLVDVNGTLYFTADDGVNGRELWKSDGTPNGTSLIKDILPSASDNSPANLVNANGTLFFTVGGQLWKSNGTSAGTLLVKEVGGNPERLTNVNGTVFFTAYKTVDERFYGDDNYQYWTIDGNFQLWKSDGTAVGTTSVKTIQFGQNTGAEYEYYAIQLYPVYMASVNNRLFFTVNKSVGEFYLYTSDGTAQGTINLNDASDVFYRNFMTPPQFNTLGSTLYFSAGYNLIKSDGTVAGTVPVKNLGISINEIRVGNNKLYLTATGNQNAQLWESNGSSEGTILIKNIQSTNNSTTLEYMTYTGKGLFFVEKNNGTHVQMWKSNGTETGTVPVDNVNPTTSEASPVLLNHVNGALFFRANDGINGTGLWKSNGTVAGTQFVKNVIPTTNEYAISKATVLNNNVFFNVFVPDGGIGDYQLWKSNGTPEGTSQIAKAGNYVNIFDLIHVNGTIFSDFGGRGLYKTDGTEAGTVLIKQIAGPTNFTNVNGILFFTVSGQLWKSNGTEIGTIKIKDIPNIGNLVNVNGTLFFSANGQIWKSNGTEQGTIKIKDIPDSDSIRGIRYLTNVNGTLFFVAESTPEIGWELWKSDGTTAGTVQVKDINPGYYVSSWPMHLTNVNGTLYFTAEDNENGRNRELWKSDGTEQGTVRITNYFIEPQYANESTIENLININGRLYFTANDGKTGMELWTSDGTPAGTSLVSDLFPGPESAQISSLMNVSGTLYFAANNGKTGQELWKYDPGSCIATIQRSLTLQGSNTCSGNNGTITIKASQAGITYQALINNSPIGNAVQGNGSDLILTIPAVSLVVGNNIYKIRVTGCTVADLTNTATITVTSDCAATTCAATGSILREYWANVSGVEVSTIPLNTPPTASSQLTSFEAPSNAGNNYGQRIRGYICVPQNGTYTFYIAGDDNCELYLSTDDDPAKKTRIAYITGTNRWTLPQQWTKFPNQKSVAIALVAGKKYYIEALHKENLYSDNLAVGWQTSPTSPITVIPGSALSPYIPQGEGKISREYWANVSGSLVSDIPLNTAPTTTDELTTFETPTNSANNYGQRLRGYVHPQVSGNYRFYIAGDDRCELWLSSDEAPEKKTKIASVPYFTGVREWTKYSSQKSAEISLIAGRKYYIEALHKEGPYSDNLAVGWSSPGQTAVSVIAGNYLSPFLPVSTNMARVGVAETFIDNVSIYPNPFADNLTLTSTQAGKRSISVVDNLGRTVYQTTSQETETQLQLGALKAGVYVVKVATDDGTTTVQKVIKR